MSSVNCWFHTASSWPVCLQQWDCEAGKPRSSLWWTDSLFWSLWANSDSNGCLLRISDLTWGEWGDYGVSLRSEERYSFCSGQLGSESHWNVKRWLLTRELAFTRTDLNPHGLRVTGSLEEQQEGSSAVLPEKWGQAWKPVSVISEGEHRLHSISTFPSLATIQKRSRLPSLWVTHTRCWCPWTLPVPATVPQITSSQRSGIWSSLSPIHQHFNCVQLFVCSAI